VNEFQKVASRLTALLTLAVLPLAACNEDTTGPVGSGDADPVQTAASMDEVVASFENNQALQSFNALGGRFGTAFGAAPAIEPSTLETPLLSRGLERITLRALAVTKEQSSAYLFGVIPVEYQGVTFIYDEIEGKYVPSERPGAPETGVRFILYAMNPVTKEPVIEAEVGYVDFIDESDATANRVRVVVVSEGVTYIDYLVTCGFVVGGLEVSGVGFITDGETQVNLDLSMSFSQSEGTSFDYKVDVPSEDLELQLQMSGIGQGPNDDTFSAYFFVRHETATIEFELTANQGELNGEVRYRDQLMAVISGTVEAPVVTDAQGNELTQEELQALHRLLMAFGRAADHLSAFLAPAFEICFLSN
jgi:hypothetical protein